MTQTKIPVLDKGYLRLVGNLGDDLEIVNSARVSFQKESEKFTTSDAGVINYCMREGHTSVLRHCVLKFEIKAPLLVARQWYKHVVASLHTEEQFGWNEASHRYITHKHEFYTPTEWRMAPADKKQGSAGLIEEFEAAALHTQLKEQQENALSMYNSALALGVAPEQARLFLLAYGLYVYWRWTASLESVANFLVQRTDSHAQYEIRQYADVIKDIVLGLYPVTMPLYLKYNGVTL